MLEVEAGRGPQGLWLHLLSTSVYTSLVLCGGAFLPPLRLMFTFI